ncbi:type II toxin-antitoxin system HipA family toxin [Rheinheimera sp. MMS21-TC3]|uniref:type II toxin-antitoxin system HipA family toxin n=2 Tax=unclassified Rheinheimera TaxID=115860 RepID=UPI0028C50EB5|nr:type II toxin-antitoxin system HipA family toxin [Rheinheimera sp. MMS21-TC3]WNO59922.1 type II toxin-antitoxin system HipA family toxin [Rheinheimera sp. MMS21-TC3]
MQIKLTSQHLAIWMNGDIVGYWHPVKHTFQYDDAWIANPLCRPLSLSLPIVPGNSEIKSEAVLNYFDNLLPDTMDIRRRIATKFGTKNTEASELLRAVGRDCIGAIQILPIDEIPDISQIEGKLLAESDVADLLIEVPKGFGRSHKDDPLRLSLAGAQEKTGLLLFEENWYIPSGSTPTTHIFKLPLGLIANMNVDLSTSVENEWLCSRIVQGYGIPVANCQPMSFSNGKQSVKALVVERFDRKLLIDDGVILRLPQEDMCQALGINSLNKYESDQGPTAKAIMDILQSGSNSQADSQLFFRALIVFWILAAIDGHAKNFSIQLKGGNKYQLAPLYDVLSAHPIIGKGANQIAKQKAELAMSVVSNNKHKKIFSMAARHWITFGQHLGLRPDIVMRELSYVYYQTNKVIDSVKLELPKDFPESVSNPIFTGMTVLNEKLAVILE